MSNIFKSISNNIRGSSFVVWIFILSIFAMFIGLVHFVEDTYSSYLGLQQLEVVFGLKPTNYSITYLTMSIAPQVGQVIFAYIFLLDRKKNWWAGVIAALFFVVDFTADLQDRSNNQLFPTDGEFGNPVAIAISTLITFGYFTVGSELFITAGAGLILELFNDALEQAINLYVTARRAWLDAKVKLRQANDNASRRSPNVR